MSLFHHSLPVPRVCKNFLPVRSGYSQSLTRPFPNRVEKFLTALAAPKSDEGGNGFVSMPRTDPFTRHRTGGQRRWAGKTGEGASPKQRHKKESLHREQSSQILASPE